MGVLTKLGISSSALSYSNFYSQKQSGFSLIEVMVAMVIIGVSLPVLVGRMQGILDQTIYMEERTYAHWIAENTLQELIVEQELSEKLSKQKKHQDTVSFGGREWSWNAEVIPTELPEMFRVNMSVSLENAESSLAEISGFIYQPADANATGG